MFVTSGHRTGHSESAFKANVAKYLGAKEDLDKARKQETEADAKMRAAHAQVQAARAGKVAADAEIKAVRVQGCKEIHKKLDMAISLLNARIKDLEVRKDSAKKREFIKNISALISAANKIKADARPDKGSLEKIFQRLEELGDKCKDLIVKIETAKRNQEI